MALGRKEIAIDGKNTRFSQERQPEKNGRKPDPFKAALEELAQSNGQFIVSQTEIIGLFDVVEGEDGMPLITIRGDWARDANGEPDKRLALITVQLPDATAIVAQWFRDAKSRKDNIRTRSRETLFDRVLGKPMQKIEGEMNINPLKIIDDM